MSVITDTWRQLVRRRLWPVAVLLVAALAAVPFLLSKDPEQTVSVAPPSGAATGKGVLASEPIVSVAGPEDRAKRRHVLGARHDIFKPTAKPPKAPKEAKVATANAGGEASGPAETPAQGASGGGTATTPLETLPLPLPVPVPVAPAPAPAPATPAKKWPADSLTVRFGDSTAESREKMLLRRLRPLPSAEDPVAIYLRLKDDGKTAVFLLKAGVVPTGDGRCRPDRRSCETVELKAGETEFLDVVGEDGEVAAQYQLDVLKIHHDADEDEAAAKPVARVLKARVAMLP
jgi:hypothetical protein